MFDRKRIVGFEWDHGNIDKNFVKHKVTRHETEEVFFDKSLMIYEDHSHSEQEQRIIALGLTKQGRLLFVAFTVRKNRIRTISARDAKKKERRIYEEKTRNTKI